MTASGRDATSCKQFNAAPPKLRKAMNNTIKARESLNWLKLVGTDATRLLHYQERLEELERVENQLRDALCLNQPG